MLCVVRPWGVQRRGSDERTGQESDSAQRMALSLGTCPEKVRGASRPGLTERAFHPVWWLFVKTNTQHAGMESHPIHPHFSQVLTQQDWFKCPFQPSRVRRSWPRMSACCCSNKRGPWAGDECWDLTQNYAPKNTSALTNAENVIIAANDEPASCRKCGFGTWFVLFL